jgi:hypothetical protein
MRKKLTNHLVKGWKTTLIGTILLIAAIVSVFLVDNINWFDASIAIGLGLALMFSPDNIISRISSFFKRNSNDFH